MSKLIFPEALWAGTDLSLQIAQQAHGQIMQASMSAREEDVEEVPYLFSKQGDVGIVSIKGSLVNRDSMWNRYFGVTSYADISRALVHAASDPSVKGVLLDIDSGGGAVNGVSDVGDLIARIDTKVKPVWAFSGGMMASAAYWIGSSARKVFASNVATLGSIGVILTHMEYSKQLQDEGVGVNVLRAGKYKALMNPIEKLSADGERIAQEQLDAAYTVFINQIAGARNVTPEVADKKMGQGRTFFGADAVTAGLADGNESFDTVLSKFGAKLLDKQPVTHSNYRNHQRIDNDMSRAGLTDVQIAALAAGVPVAEAALDTPAVVAPEVDTSAQTEVTAPVAEAAPVAAAPAADTGVLAFVQGQLTAAQGEVVDLRVQLKVAQDQLAAANATHAPLLAIAAQSLTNMRVALGLAAVDATVMSAETVVAEHTATSASFKKAFKVGGVAAPNVKDETQAAAPQAVDPNRLRRIQATSKA